VTERSVGKYLWILSNYASAMGYTSTMNQLCSTLIICGLLVLHGPAIVVAETLPIDVPAELASSVDNAVGSGEIEVGGSIVLDEGVLAHDIIQAPQVDSDMLNTLLPPENGSLDHVDAEDELVLDVLQSALITSDSAQVAGQDGVELTAEIAIDPGLSDSSDQVEVIVPAVEAAQGPAEPVLISELVVPVEVGIVVVGVPSAAIEQASEIINEYDVVRPENLDLLSSGDSSAEVIRRFRS
jgi:hypothetical protein